MGEEKIASRERKCMLKHVGGAVLSDVEAYIMVTGMSD